MKNEKKKHFLVPGQFPPRFLETSEKLISFIEAYYEWLDQDGNVRDQITNFSDILDLDESIERFFSEFKFELLSLYPEEVEVNKAILAKRIKDFYISKGTPKASAFFFSSVYDAFAETLLFPNRQLQVESTIYFERIVRVVFDEPVASNFFAGKVLRSSNNTDNLVTVNFSSSGNINGQFYYELVIDDPLISFNVGEEFTVDGSTGTGQFLPIIDNITINDGGSGFEVGNIVTYLFAGVGGSGVSLRVGEVDGGGSITQIAIIDPGVGYTIAPTTNMNFGDGVGANLTLEIGTSALVRKSVQRFVPQNQNNNFPTINYNLYLKMIDGPGNYDIGETVRQFDSFGNITYENVVVGWDEVTRTLLLTSPDESEVGVFDSDKFLLGITSETSRLSEFTRPLRIDAGDGEVFTQFSYRLRTTVPPSVYADLYKRNAHPAGLRFVPEILIDVGDGELDFDLYPDGNFDINFLEDENEKYKELIVRVNPQVLESKINIENISAEVFIDSLTQYKDFFDIHTFSITEPSVKSYVTLNRRPFVGGEPEVEENDIHTLSKISKRWFRAQVVAYIEHILNLSLPLNTANVEGNEFLIFATLELFYDEYETNSIPVGTRIIIESDERYDFEQTLNTVILGFPESNFGGNINDYDEFLQFNFIDITIE